MHCLGPPSGVLGPRLVKGVSSAEGRGFALAGDRFVVSPWPNGAKRPVGRRTAAEKRRATRGSVRSRIDPSPPTHGQVLLCPRSRVGMPAARDAVWRLTLCADPSPPLSPIPLLGRGPDPRASAGPLSPVPSKLGEVSVEKVAVGAHRLRTSWPRPSCSASSCSSDR
jgi:hypothetical protein